MENEKYYFDEDYEMRSIFRTRSGKFNWTLVVWGAAIASTMCVSAWATGRLCGAPGLVFLIDAVAVVLFAVLYSAIGVMITVIVGSWKRRRENAIINRAFRATRCTRCGSYSRATS